jgi:hypothetical protein
MKKKKKPLDKPVPFMNKNLKRAIYKKKSHIISTIDVKINKIGKYIEHLSTIEFKFFCSKSFKKSF